MKTQGKSQHSSPSFPSRLGSQPVSAGLKYGLQKGRFPSAEKLETPPDDALSINPGVARILLKQLLEKRTPVHIPDRLLIPGAEFFESTNVKVAPEAASFDYETADKKNKNVHHAKLVFKRLDYAIYGPGENKGPFFCAADFSKEFRAAVDALFLWNVLTWRDEKDARLLPRYTIDSSMTLVTEKRSRTLQPSGRRLRI